VNTKTLKQKILAELLTNAEWKTVKLGEVCDYGKCKTVKSADIPDNAWILDLEDIEKDTGKLLKRILKAEKNTTSVRHSFKKGEVLYSKLRTYLNKVLVADIDGFCTTEIIPIDFKGKVIPEFARFILMSPMFLEYTEQCGYGVKMPRLGTNDAKRADFPLPPLSVQKSIVERIERLFAEIDRIETARQELLQLVKTAKQKTLQLAITGELTSSDTSTWKTVKLGEVCEFIRNGATIKNNKDAKGFPITRIETISDGTVNFDRMGYADIFNILPYERYVLKKNDILMSHINSPIHVGKSALYVPKEKNEIIIHGMNLLCFRPLKIIIGKFLNYYFNSENFKEQIQPFIKNAVNQASINIGNLSNILIPLPPLSVQQQIVDKIEATFAELDRIESTIRKC